MSLDTSYERCPKCKEPCAPGKKFCADCGAPLDPASAHIRALIEDQVDRAFETRFKDQRYVALETAVAAADKPREWLTHFLYWAAIPLALIAILLAILGFRTYNDFTSKVTAAEKQVERVSAAAQKTAEAAQQKASDVSKTLGSIGRRGDEHRPRLGRQLAPHAAYRRLSPLEGSRCLRESLRAIAA